MNIMNISCKRMPSVSVVCTNKAHVDGNNNECMTFTADVMVCLIADMIVYVFGSLGDNGKKCVCVRKRKREIGRKAPFTLMTPTGRGTNSCSTPWNQPPPTPTTTNPQPSLLLNSFGHNFYIFTLSAYFILIFAMFSLVPYISTFSPSILWLPLDLFCQHYVNSWCQTLVHYSIFSFVPSSICPQLFQVPIVLLITFFAPSFLSF